MRDQLMKENIEMFQAFLAESIESLQKIEDEILTLESCDDRSKSLDEIFARIHTIKGLSSFFCLTDITRLGHQTESLLEVMRNDNIEFDEKIIEILLATKDALVQRFSQLGEECNGIFLETVQEVEGSSTYDVDLLIADMAILIEQYTEPSTSDITVVEIFQPGTITDTHEQCSIVRDNAETIHYEPISIAIDELARGLIEDFLLEADEHIGIITDNLLLVLDMNPEDTETLADLFRRVHSLKGNLGLVLSVPLDEVLQNYLKELLDVLQNMESILACVRDSKMPISGEIINLCFETLDVLSSTTATLAKGGIAPQGIVRDVAGRVLALRDKVKSTSQLRVDGGVIAPLDEKKVAVKKAVSKSTDNTGVTVNNSIRVSGDKIDRLMNIIGELSITKNVFSQIARKLNMEYNLPNVAREVKDAGQFVNRISAELEEAIMAMRMTEVRIAFQKFPRIVRDVAMQTGKNISLILEGEDTELDKNIIEQIGDPLLHLVRNSCDHGIETMEERRAVGKDPQGNVWLRAYSRGKHVIIEVEDDGKGMDPTILKRKAVEKKFLTEQQAESISDEQAFQLIFLPGFSTAENVTEISGRGVGMDVVNSNIAALQGTLKITSELGKGSKIMMQLPLTLMVSRGLVVDVQGQLLVIPIDNVLEMVKVSTDKLVQRCSKRILYHRGQVLGVVSLAEILNMPRQELAEYTPLVIITDGQSQVAMIVDKLLSEQDILVKPLPDYLSAIGGMGGATIMGDGKVALVLNPVELIQIAIRH